MIMLVKYVRNLVPASR